MGVCYIVCALDCAPDFEKREGDLIIGADRGYLNLKRAGISPDVVMGDFDSYSGSVNCENIVRFPVIKDDTDSAIAIKYAIERGYREIAVYGAIGGNLDHTIANIAHLANYTEKGIDISFMDGKTLFLPFTTLKSHFQGMQGAEYPFLPMERAHREYVREGCFMSLIMQSCQALSPLV